MAMVHFLAAMSLSDRFTVGAPSFDLFGAFFPAWMLCALIGIVGAIGARAVFISTGFSNALPHQLILCTAIGVTTGTLVWLYFFGS